MFNRRNAMVGWAVWSIGKRMARRKAKAAVPTVDAGTRRPNRAAMLLGALAAVAGAMFFWRRRHDDADVVDVADDAGDPGDAMG